MRVLHITNELTKKNFSIASLILFVSKHIYNVYKFKYSILTSKTEFNLFDDKNISKIEIIIYSDDLGNTWEQASVPTTKTLTDIDCANETTCWVTGHDAYILKTVDRGENWSTLFPHGHVGWSRRASVPDRANSPRRHDVPQNIGERSDQSLQSPTGQRAHSTIPRGEP